MGIQLKYLISYAIIFNDFDGNNFLLIYPVYYGVSGTWAHFHNQGFTLSVNPNNC